ncbi:MAG: 2-oxo acid dehydrogenase subunit E2 [Gemmataceae bacterium]
MLIEDLALIFSPARTGARKALVVQVTTGSPARHGAGNRRAIAEHTWTTGRLACTTYVQPTSTLLVDLVRHATCASCMAAARAGFTGIWPSAVGCCWPGGAARQGGCWMIQGRDRPARSLLHRSRRLRSGRFVPVVRDADSFACRYRQDHRAASPRRARTGKSKRDDLVGGTFTITSIGNIGGLFAAPIIPHPQVGILGMGKIVKRPIYDGAGQLKPADMLYLSFSFDHRVLDGAVGCAFGNAIIRRLQKPGELLV